MGKEMLLIIKGLLANVTLICFILILKMDSFHVGFQITIFEILLAHITKSFARHLGGL